MRHTRVVTLERLAELMRAGGYRWVAPPFEAHEITSCVQIDGQYRVRLLSEDGTANEFFGPDTQMVTIEEDPFVGL